MSVYIGNFRMQSVVVYLPISSVSTAYICLCRGLKYLLKVPYIILNYPKITEFLIFKTLCLGTLKTLPYVWKIYHKNERHLFITHIFNKLSQIVRLINVHILVCQHSKSDCSIWRVLWFNCVFWEFSYISICLNFDILNHVQLFFTQTSYTITSSIYF